jgi:hypothetical protein
VDEIENMIRIGRSSLRWRSAGTIRAPSPESHGNKLTNSKICQSLPRST